MMNLQSVDYLLWGFDSFWESITLKSENELEYYSNNESSGDLSSGIVHLRAFILLINCFFKGRRVIILCTQKELWFEDFEMIYEVFEFQNLSIFFSKVFCYYPNKYNFWGFLISFGKVKNKRILFLCIES